MRRLQVQVSSIIDAPPTDVYAVLADYRSGHPQIVPPKYFRNLEVEEGGVGAGTRLKAELHLFGSKRVFRQLVSEPEPGRVLRETNDDGAAVTTFTVDPAAGGRSTHLTIATEFTLQSSGLRAAIESRMISLIFPRIYRAELETIRDYFKAGEKKYVQGQ